MIPPGTEIKLPSSEVWTAQGFNYLAPRPQMLRVAKALERTKGCIVDARLMAATIANLEYQVKELELALSAIDTASTALRQVEAVRQSLDLRQKIRQWFKDRWKELTAFILGVIAATEAAYIIYTTVTL